MKNAILIIAFVISTTLSHSATITATASGGDWSSGASWVGGVVPVSGVDNVVIPNGSTITLTGAINFDGVIDVDGDFNIGIFFSTDGFLTMSATSSVNVTSNGTLFVNSPPFGNSSLTIGVNSYSFFDVILATIANGGTGISIAEVGIVAPVELLFFEARIKNQIVELTWATATEENFDYFALERSVDGVEFIEIAQIQGMGDSFKRVDYSFEDEFPLMGRSYYRLRSVDFDGYTEIFDYAMVITEGLVEDFNVFPNPITNGQFSIQTNFDLDSETQLVIYNSTGGVEREYILNNWLGDYQINGLRPGSYLFKIGTQNGFLVKRVLVN